MSNLLSSKPLTKPLKGGSVSSNVGIFETISAQTLVLADINVAGLIENGILTGAIIKDSDIYNTIIGAGGPNIAYFTKLYTNQDVFFGGSVPGADVTWDSTTNEFAINSTSASFRVDGCSYLGNIEICRNTIRAVNSNGDIIIKPNNLGSTYFDGSIVHTASIGNFSSVIRTGGASFVVNNNIVLYSSYGSINLTSFDNQTLSTINGNLTLGVDTGISTRTLSSVRFTAGSILLTTSSPHNLKVGDVINVTNGSLNGGYTVGSLISSTVISLTNTTNTTSLVTGGNLIKVASNDIILNTQSKVTVPNNIPITFGTTCNKVYGNTGGLVLESCQDVYFNVNTNKIVRIPQTTKLQFGTSGSNYINFDGTSLNMVGTTTKIQSTTTEIESTNTKFYDPILTIANYTPVYGETKDRGIEFTYYDEAFNSVKLGWFGFKKNTGKFTFLTNAVNNNEVMSGDIGSLELAGLTLNSITLSTGGTINAACGQILNVKMISGCSNNLTINGSTNVAITADNRISLTAGVDILVPNNVPMKFGTSGSAINETTSQNLQVTSAKNLQIATQTKGSIIIPVETAVSFDGTSVGNQKIVSNTVGDLIIASNKAIYLTTTGGNVIVPTSTQIQFGTTSQNISGTTSGIILQTVSPNSSLELISSTNVNISSSFGNIVLQTQNGDINLYPTNGNVRIPTTRRLIFGTSGTINNMMVTSSGSFILTGNSSNTYQITSFNSIDLNASSNINIPANTRLRLGTNNEQTLYTDTSGNTFISNTTGNTNIISNTNITASSFIITGTTGSLTQINTDNVRIKDPIITIGDSTLSTSDSKDRGLEYRYYGVGSMKLGWFGRKDTTGRFTFYSDATNTNEVISGTMGDIEISSAYIQRNLSFVSSGTLDLNCGTIANVNTITGCGSNLNINAANILLNATSKIQIPNNIPIAFGTTSNSISCDTSGVMTISTNRVVFNSDVQINGTTFTVYSTVTNLQDPIFSLGGVTGPIVNDNKDRGIEFKWNDGSNSKTGFFGYKNNLQRFVFIRDGINTDEVYSGSYGNVQFGDGFFNNVNLFNGNISGINTLSGGQITISTTSGNINLTPTRGSNILIPYNTNLSFGTTENSLSSDTSGNLTILSKNDTTILSKNGDVNISTSDAVRLPGNVPIYLGTDNNTYIMRNTSNNLVINNSSGDVNLTPAYSTGNVVIPLYNTLAFGDTKNSIYSDGSKLYLRGYDALNISSSTINIGGTINIVGSLSAGASDIDINKYILPLGTFQVLTVSNIQSTTSTPGNTSITTTQIGNLSVGDSITLRGTGTTPSIDGTYTITKINSNTSFNISTGTTLSSNVTIGNITTNLTTYQGKDVGIQVNYWSTVGNVGITAGSTGFKTGFFGFRNDTQRWAFYSNATISNNVVSGTFGDIEVNKVNTTRMSGFILDGSIVGGTNGIGGSNFQISGGSINNTPIGSLSPNSGVFSTLSNQVSAAFNNVTLQSRLAYSFERYTLSSGVPTRSPSESVIVSMFSVTGVNFTSSSGTMPSTSISDGTFKILLCSSMGEGCTHTVHFGAGKLISPNPLNSASQPTKIVFKRRSQSVQLMYDAVQSAWILLNSGAYIQ
jgi:hypothetical protein